MQHAALHTSESEDKPVCWLGTRYKHAYLGPKTRALHAVSDRLETLTGPVLSERKRGNERLKNCWSLISQEFIGELYITTLGL